MSVHMKILVKIVATAILLWGVDCAFGAERARPFNEGKSVCRDLRALHAIKGAIYVRTMQAMRFDDGKFRIPNVDIDGDDISDEIIWERSDSSSKLPPDLGTLLINLSKGGQLKFQESRFSLFKHRAQIYIAAELFSTNAEAIGRKFYSVNDRGIRFVCESLHPKN